MFSGKFRNCFPGNAGRDLDTAERKRIYELRHPETRHGGNHQPCGQFGHTVEPSFVKDTAQKTGQSERNVRRDAHRGEKIGAEDLSKVVGTSLDKGEELDALAKLSPAVLGEAV